MKINFTKEHYEELKKLALEALMNNITINTRIGGVVNIVDLLHTITINSLNNIRLSLQKEIDNLENQDEWTVSITSQKNLEDLRNKKNLINLIIGWKRYNIEQDSIKSKRKALEEELNSLKESQKTPEDKIKELEAKLSTLSVSEF